MSLVASNNNLPITDYSSFISYTIHNAIFGNRCVDILRDYLGESDAKIREFSLFYFHRKIIKRESEFVIDSFFYKYEWEPECKYVGSYSYFRKTGLETRMIYLDGCTALRIMLPVRSVMQYCDSTGYVVKQLMPPLRGLFASMIECEGRLSTRKPEVTKQKIAYLDRALRHLINFLREQHASLESDISNWIADLADVVGDDFRFKVIPEFFYSYQLHASNFNHDAIKNAWDGFQQRQIFDFTLSSFVTLMENFYSCTVENAIDTIVTDFSQLLMYSNKPEELIKQASQCAAKIFLALAGGLKGYHQTNHLSLFKAIYLKESELMAHLPPDSPLKPKLFLLPKNFSSKQLHLQPQEYQKLISSFPVAKKSYEACLLNQQELEAFLKLYSHSLHRVEGRLAIVIPTFQNFHPHPSKGTHSSEFMDQFLAGAVNTKFQGFQAFLLLIQPYLQDSPEGLEKKLNALIDNGMAEWKKYGTKNNNLDQNLFHFVQDIRSALMTTFIMGLKQEIPGWFSNAESPFFKPFHQIFLKGMVEMASSIAKKILRGALNNDYVSIQKGLNLALSQTTVGLSQMEEVFRKYNNLNHSLTTKK